MGEGREIGRVGLKVINMLKDKNKNDNVKKSENLNIIKYIKGCRRFLFYSLQI